MVLDVVKVTGSKAKSVNQSTNHSVSHTFSVKVGFKGIPLVLVLDVVQVTGSVADTEVARLVPRASFEVMVDARAVKRVIHVA